MQKLLNNSEQLAITVEIKYYESVREKQSESCIFLHGVFALF